MPKLLAIGMIPTPIHTFNKHKHTVWEIVYYTHGSGVLTVEDEPHDFVCGMIVCLPPGAAHSEYSGPGYKNFHLSCEDFSLPCGKLPVFHDNDDRDLHSLMHQLYKVFHMKPDNWEGITDGLFNTLCQYLLSQCVGGTRNQYVERLKGILVANLSNERFTIEEGLDALPLANDYLRSLFKKETGSTPLEYLTELRISHAKKLLLNVQYGGGKVYEIARLSGFADPFYFTRVFKRATGRSPSKWKQE